ncbi:hypothetical protein [Curtobacterium sp. MCBA15_001]|uniref:ApeA N-terminal domain 1-containing protein n=1 Tax=Curtobacterium sp. MCBA15_001 TaxID=1898731 RepID=UPI0008DDBFC1|nr:hypothetical protein [Curtobacterium sp. MCBA15_001]OIH97899.1 hypothetical protein BIU90_12830 [Curtobacterium sp. MCBA15_001]
MVESLKTIEEQEPLLGILVDGVADSPYLGGLLTLDPARGVRVRFPFLVHDQTGQFKPTDDWLRSRQASPGMLFHSDRGSVSLFQCSIAQTARHWGGGRVPSATVAAREAVVGIRRGSLDAPLLVRALRSHADGLSEWTGFKASDWEPTLNEHGRIRSITATVETLEEFSWTQGDARMTLTTHWEGRNGRAGLHVDESVTLASDFGESRSVEDHLAQHRKVRSLLVLIFGRGIYFRKHEVKDEAFGPESLSDDEPRLSLLDWQHLVTRSTVREQSNATPDSNLLRRDGLVGLADVEVGGLERWAQLPDQWKRVIDPTVGLLMRERPTVEDVVISTNLSLEAAGHLLPPAPNEEETCVGGTRPTTATWVLRCLARTGLNFSAFADSTVGLARAVANNYNGIKHFDRGELPDLVHTWLIGQVSLLTVRVVALRELETDSGLLSDFAASELARDLSGDFEGEQLCIGRDGQFHSTVS